jgi:hypothetical protein
MIVIVGYIVIFLTKKKVPYVHTLQESSLAVAFSEQICLQNIHLLSV